MNIQNILSAIPGSVALKRTCINRSAAGESTRLVYFSGSSASNTYFAGVGIALVGNWILTCEHVATQQIGTLNCYDYTQKRFLGQAIELYIENDYKNWFLTSLPERVWTSDDYLHERLALVRINTRDNWSPLTILANPTAKVPDAYLLSGPTSQIVSDSCLAEKVQFSALHPPPSQIETKCVIGEDILPTVNGARPVVSGDSGAPIFINNPDPALVAIQNCLIEFNDGHRTGAIAAGRAPNWLNNRTGAEVVKV